MCRSSKLQVTDRKYTAFQLALHKHQMPYELPSLCVGLVRCAGPIALLGAPSLSYTRPLDVVDERSDDFGNYFRLFGKSAPA